MIKNGKFLNSRWRTAAILIENRFFGHISAADWGKHNILILEIT